MPRREPTEHYTLPKDYIIKSSREIGEIFRRGKRYSGSYISASYVMLHDRGTARVAFTVSKKVRRAVDRNRLKRLMREVFRLNREKLDLILAGKGVGLDLVMNCGCDHPANVLLLKDIEKDFEQFLFRISSDMAS